MRRMVGNLRTKLGSLYLFASVTFILSCQREQDWVGAPEIIATLEEVTETRTSISVDGSGAGTIYWSPSDQIDVFFGTKKATYTLQNTSSTTVTFKTTDYVSNTDLLSTNIWGLYPANSSSTCNGSAITTTLPATQYGVANTFDDDLFPAIAHSTSTSIQFYNVCGGIKFNMAYADIKKVTFRGNNNENIAGTVSITFTDGVPKATVTSGVKEITLTPKSGSTFTQGADYYIILLPGTLSNGFTITFTAKDGTVGTLNYTDKSVTIKRSVFGRKGKMDVYAAFADGRQPNNVIYYTSVNGSIIYPPETDAFGTIYEDVSIVLNEYVGGRGIFTCDGNVRSIGNRAFWLCGRLSSIEIPHSVTSIGDYAFYNCYSLTSIELPDSVKSIGDYAFEGCSDLTTIEFPDSLTSIGNYAFRDCHYLSSIKLPVSISHIGNSAFEDCGSLTSIEIPNSITSIGSSVFSDCFLLNSITVYATLPPTIGAGAFDDTNDCPIYVPEESVDAYKTAWSDYKKRIRAIVPKNVIYYTTVEGDYGFDPVTPYNPSAFGANIVSNERLDGWWNKFVITFDGDVTSIGEAAFSGCTNLYDITIPNSVTSIGDSAFRGCRNLSRITLPESVTSIGSEPFHGCSSLTFVTVLNVRPPTISGSTFVNPSEWSPRPPDYYDYRILVPDALVNEYKIIWYSNDARIYALPGHLASGLALPPSVNDLTIQLSDHTIYTESLLKAIGLRTWSPDGPALYYLINNGSWIMGDGDNGIPAGISALEFYKINWNCRSDESALSQPIRQMISLDKNTLQFTFDYTSEITLTETIRVPVQLNIYTIFGPAVCEFNVIIIGEG